MADFTPPRIESISDPNSRAQDQPAPKPRAKAAAAGKPTPYHVPQVSAPEAEDIHELDEMA
jgi:hypothetical protein